MNPVEALSARSAARTRHPAESLVLGGALLVAVLSASAWESLLLAAFIAVGLTLGYARPPLRLYLALWVGVVPFLCLSGVAITFQFTGNGFAFSPPLLPLAVFTSVRAFAASAVALLLACLQPVSAWIAMIGTARHGGDLLTIITYALKAIVLFSARAVSLGRAASWRMGSRGACGLLVATSLISTRIWERSWQDIRGWHYGMLARGGDGTVRTLCVFPSISRTALLGATAPAALVLLLDGFLR